MWIASKRGGHGKSTADEVTSGRSKIRQPDGGQSTGRKENLRDHGVLPWHCSGLIRTWLSSFSVGCWQISGKPKKKENGRGLLGRRPPPPVSSTPCSAPMNPPGASACRPGMAPEAFGLRSIDEYLWVDFQLASELAKALDEALPE